MPLKNQKLFILFISSMDLRRINPEHTPFICNLVNNFPWVKLTAVPEVDLDPTILTGRYPHEHGMWQLEINTENANGAFKEDSIDRLPDIVTTTFQCLVHLITGNYDLAAIPRWRRKRFIFRKTRYYERTVDKFLNLNGVDTIFNMIGSDNCNFVYLRRLNELNDSFGKFFQKENKLEFFEVHALDTIQHWNLDDIGKLMGYYKLIDDYVKHLYEKCAVRGVTFALLSEHGMEPVRGFIDITKKLKSLGIPRVEYTYYIEAPKTRFFFHSERAREKILDLLNNLDNGEVLSYKDLHKYNVKFEGDKWGEYYFIANPGYIFFPNDFHHPLANVFLGMKDSQQRRRLINPRYRGYHGYLSEYESEKGFIVVAGENIQKTSVEGEIIDIAPTILDLLGVENTYNLQGNVLFK